MGEIPKIKVLHTIENTVNTLKESNNTSNIDTNNHSYSKVKLIKREHGNNSY